MTDLYSQKFNLEKGWPGLLKSMGISAQDVLRHARLPEDLLLRSTPAVTADEYYRFWEGLAHASGHEPDLARRLAETISVNAVAPAIIAFLSSGDLNTALRRMARYKPVVAPVRMFFEQNDQNTVLTFGGLPRSGPLPPLFVAFELMFWVQLARLATRRQLSPVSVHASVPLPGREVCEAFLDTRIRQDEVNRLTFSAEDAREPFLTANHAMWSILEPVFDSRMDALTHTASFRQRVRACLLDMLASGSCSLNHTARRLAVSSRTLQRRLHDEGTTFQDVLDELREELARHYLSATDFSSADISFLLGYEEPNSFYRAFHAWTGQTPEIVRSGGLAG